MLNIFAPAEDLVNSVTKYCERRVDHRIVMYVLDDNVNCVTISLDNKNKLKATWLLEAKGLSVWTEGPDSVKTHLPYFEPDLSNYKKLVNKIKTYLVFS